MQRHCMNCIIQINYATTAGVVITSVITSQLPQLLTSFLTAVLPTEPAFRVLGTPDLALI
jgi:hypothetical protein